MADAEPESLTPFSFTRTLRNLEATHLVARVLAPLLRTGDVVTLNGTLGTGKTAFARALLRILAQDSTLEVPSPTFTLLQIYDTPSMAVVHADLYRINDPEELEELGWDEAAQDALMLVEWPDRLGPLTPQSRLDLSFSLTNEDLDTRILTITGYGEWAERLQTFHRLQDFLERSGFGAARRIPIQGDASTRAYERLEMDGKSVIFMIAPKRPDGPPIRWGKSYSALAHLSESVDAFVAMADALRKQGLSAPEIYAQDLEHGLLIVEDLGHEGIVTAGQPVEECYQAAVDVLADLHRHPLPLRLPVKGADDHMLPLYDLDALGIETELLLDWYIPHHLNKELSANARSQFVSLWRETLTPVTEQDPTWTLRDYHSPNLLWLPAREGIKRIGIIDFQDAVMGHPSYDLVSLLQDARLPVSEAMEMQLLRHYVDSRRSKQMGFNFRDFVQSYAIMGAQRATKILGIFVRLNKRDNKPDYLRHIPHIEAYLRRNLKHPALAALHDWYQTNLPKLMEPRA